MLRQWLLLLVQMKREVICPGGKVRNGLPYLSWLQSMCSFHNTLLSSCDSTPYGERLRVEISRLFFNQSFKLAEHKLRASTSPHWSLYLDLLPLTSNVWCASSSEEVPVSLWDPRQRPRQRHLEDVLNIHSFFSCLVSILQIWWIEG